MSCTTSRVGKNCKVTIGADKVLGMGNWTIDPGTVNRLDNSEFGDDSVKTCSGMKGEGTVTFNGNYKPDDTTGQDVIIAAFSNDTLLTDLRFWIDGNSYWRPTSGSYIQITAQPITADMADMMKINFTGALNGSMELVW